MGLNTRLVLTQNFLVPFLALQVFLRALDTGLSIVRVRAAREYDEGEGRCET